VIASAGSPNGGLRWVQLRFLLCLLVGVRGRICLAMRLRLRGIGRTVCRCVRRLRIERWTPLAFRSGGTRDWVAGAWHQSNTDVLGAQGSLWSQSDRAVSVWGRSCTRVAVRDHHFMGTSSPRGPQRGGSLRLTRDGGAVVRLGPNCLAELGVTGMLVGDADLALWLGRTIACRLRVGLQPVGVRMRQPKRSPRGLETTRAVSLLGRLGTPLSVTPPGRRVQKGIRDGDTRAVAAALQALWMGAADRGASASAQGRASSVPALLGRGPMTCVWCGGRLGEFAPDVYSADWRRRFLGYACEGCWRARGELHGQVQAARAGDGQVPR